MFFMIFLDISLIWEFHFKCWSMKTPRNLDVSTCGIIVLSMVSSQSVIGIVFLLELNELF